MRSFHALAPRHLEPRRPRLQPGYDPGGYAAYGYEFLVPSDLLKFPVHNAGDTM